MTASEFQRVGLVIGTQGVPGIPQTIVAAATIAPNCGFIKISGTTALGTITPPILDPHLMFVLAGSTGGFTTAGNLIGVPTTAVSTTTPYALLYDPVQAKYLQLALA